MVLSHPEQQERLAHYGGGGGPRGVLAGDPCFDRMLAARRYRERYRRALGVRHGQRLVVLNSTWNPESLFGDGAGTDPERAPGHHHLREPGNDVLRRLLARLPAQLPVDDYRLAAVLHPNIWHGHGPGQVRTWLDSARRAGLTLIDPLHDWRQAVLAADAVIGDFGSVSYYAAALGTPVLLAATGADRLDPLSPVARFVRTAPRLDPAAPLGAQLDALIGAQQGPRPGPDEPGFGVPGPTEPGRTEPGPAELTTSDPGRSAFLLRRLFYELIGIGEPGSPAHLDPLPMPAYQPPCHLAPLAVRTTRCAGTAVEIRRYGDSPFAPPTGGVAHLAVHEDTLDPEALALADVLFREGAADDPVLGTPEEWTAEALARHPHAALAARVTGPAECVARLRSGDLYDLVGEPRGADPAAAASALLGWLAEGGKPDELLAGGLTVVTDAARYAVRVTRR
ncbi:hypothetical protein HUT18_04040 [Streptomyces sp. NA04227]|nr:hypothetical protein HUT18_04040 [Streptomyces sp. NA04227]